MDLMTSMTTTVHGWFCRSVRQQIPWSKMSPSVVYTQLLEDFTDGLGTSKCVKHGGYGESSNLRSIMMHEERC
eukprot:392266-Amphidinium_carterae.1